MKNYEEMAKALLARKEEYERQQQRKKKRREKLALCVASIGILTASSFGIWRSGILIQDSEDVQMANVEKEEEREAEKKMEKDDYQIVESEEDATSSSKKKNKENGKDKSVNAVNPVDLKKEDYSKVVEEDVSALSRFPVEDCTISTDLTYLSEQATEIVAGTVRKVTYDIIKGRIWTKVDIQITDVFKGNLITNDIVSVYRLGGYIPLKEYGKYHKDVARFEVDTKEVEHILLKQIFEGEEFSEVGEKSVFYLNQASSEALLPKGVYERTGGKYGQLRIVGDKLLQYQDDETKLYTWKEVQKSTDKW